jgi:hypothetical protein
MLYKPFPAVRWNILAMSSYINWEISDNVPQNIDQLDPNPEFRSVSLWIAHIVKFRNKEQYINTHPHHLHPNQTHGMQTQIRKKKNEKEAAKRSFQR